MICLHEFENPLDQIWVRPADIIMVHSGAPSGQPGGAHVLLAFGRIYHVHESAADVVQVAATGGDANAN